jgi:hypothetical protein
MRKRERLIFGKAPARERSSENDGVWDIAIHETDARTSMLLRRLAYSAAVTPSSPDPGTVCETQRVGRGTDVRLTLCKRHPMALIGFVIVQKIISMLRSHLVLLAGWCQSTLNDGERHLRRKI